MTQAPRGQDKGGPSPLSRMNGESQLCGLVLRTGGADERGTGAMGTDGAPLPVEGVGDQPPDVGRGAVVTTTGRALRTASFAKRSRWLTVPRGTPRPAMPGVIVSRRGGAATGFTVRPRPTITVARDRTGGV